MVAVLLWQEDEMYVGASRESNGEGQGSTGGLREREGEEGRTRIVSSKEELRRARSENE